MGRDESEAKTARAGIRVDDRAREDIPNGPGGRGTEKIRHSLASAAEARLVVF